MNRKETENQFIRLIKQYEHVIWKVCFIYADDNDDLKDLYQEVVLNLWKAYPRFRGESKATTWIWRIAMNTCISSIRKTSSQPVAISLSVNMDRMMEDDGKSAQLKMLYSLIGRLEKMDKALILLWLEGKSYQEMAEITGLSASNVGVKLNRIKEKLRTMSNN